MSTAKPISHRAPHAGAGLAEYAHLAGSHCLLVLGVDGVLALKRLTAVPYAPGLAFCRYFIRAAIPAAFSASSAQGGTAHPRR
ncbi:hypothetical protein ACFVGV_17555 [Pseudarthrobacter scleromae]|uniref:hypothetical protein n=1 Tax=Pseudarthrobacter scleromae TaxID=158897 RepID=UPI003625DA74